MEAEQIDSLLASVKEAIAIKNGMLRPAPVTRVAVPDVAALRKGLGLSQEEFAYRIQVSVGTLRNWEQQRRMPTGTSLALLRILEREPEAAMRALAGPAGQHA